MNEIKRPTADFNAAAKYVETSFLDAVKDHPEGNTTVRSLATEYAGRQIAYKQEVKENYSFWVQREAVKLWNNDNKPPSPTLCPPSSGIHHSSWQDYKAKAEIIIDAEITAKKAEIDKECRSKQMEVVREVQEKRAQLYQEVGVIKQNTQEQRLQTVRLFETHKTEWVQTAREQGSPTPEKDAYTRYVSMQKEVTQTQQHRTETAHQNLGFTYSSPETLTQQFSQTQSHSM